MGVTTQHHDYTDAARRALAGDLEIIARKCEAESRDQLAHAAHLLEEYQAERDTALFKQAKAEQARLVVDQLRHQPRTLTIDERAHLLDRLAEQANERAVDQHTIDTFLDLWTPGIDGNQREPLFADLCEAVALRNGLGRGGIDWRTVVGPGIGGPDRAMQRAATDVDDALWSLLRPRQRPCVECKRTRPLAKVAPAGRGIAGLCTEHAAKQAGSAA